MFGDSSALWASRITNDEILKRTGLVTYAIHCDVSFDWSEIKARTIKNIVYRNTSKEDMRTIWPCFAAKHVHREDNAVLLQNYIISAEQPSIYVGMF